jgi:hypothetical protein
MVGQLEVLQYGVNWMRLGQIEGTRVFARLYLHSQIVVNCALIFDFKLGQ